jgi:hypothetical protein
MFGYRADAPAGDRSVDTRDNAAHAPLALAPGSRTTLWGMMRPMNWGAAELT